MQAIWFVVNYLQRATIGDFYVQIVPGRQPTSGARQSESPYIRSTSDWDWDWDWAGNWILLLSTYYLVWWWYSHRYHWRDFSLKSCTTLLLMLLIHVPSSLNNRRETQMRQDLDCSINQLQVRAYKSMSCHNRLKSMARWIIIPGVPMSATAKGSFSSRPLTLEWYGISATAYH